LKKSDDSKKDWLGSAPRRNKRSARKNAVKSA
jgi:hypothetical protein